jgi:signal transduction histidine kinase
MNEPRAYDKISLLRQVFKGLQDDELQKMASLSSIRSYPADHVLCQEGALEDVFYIIADGNVIITQKLSEEEGERTLREGGNGDVIGEMALIQNVPRSASVRTTSDCTTLEMEKKDFETILSSSPRLALDIIRITLDRIRANDQLAIAELKRTNKVLRQLDRNKLEFIQVAAHELRTPLTVIKGYVDLMGSFATVKAESALVSVLEGISKGTDRMHEVVNMMLDVSRVDADTLKVDPVPVLLRNVIDTLAQELGKAASERRIEINVYYADGLPRIQGDPALIQKALYHLIINAIKYTPDGGKVGISTRPIQMGGNLPAIEIEVKDTGIGLDPEHCELVFEKFYQVGSVAIHSSGKTTFKGGGPGLGLAIVRGVARAHGGKAWVESAGHDEINFPGCAFYLQLPVNPPPE